MKKLTAYETALIAALLALTVIFAFIPYVFLLPLLLTCCIRDFKLSLISGVLFGTVSMALSYMGGSPVAYAFMQAPWIPVVTRILVAALTHLTSALLKKALKDKTRARFILRCGLTGLVGSLLNTVLVCGAILLFAPVVDGDIVMSTVMPVILTLAAPIEAAIGLTVLPPIAIAVTRLERAMPKRRAAKRAAVSAAPAPIEPRKKAEVKTEEKHETSNE